MYILHIHIITILLFKSLSFQFQAVITIGLVSATKVWNPLHHRSQFLPFYCEPSGLGHIQHRLSVPTKLLILCQACALYAV